MKSKIQFLFLAALLLGAYCCSPKGDGSVTEIMVNGDKMYAFSLNELRSDTNIIALSSLVEDCDLVQLETNDDTYVNPWFTTVTDKYIGVRQRDNRPYMLFDRSGKFITNVGSQGGGPGEYTISLYDDIIDDKNELVYLTSMNSDKIMVYNTSGQFLRDIVAPIRLQKPKMFLEDGILTVIHMPFGNQAIAAQFNASTGEVLRGLTSPSHLVVRSFDGEIFNTRNVPGVFDFLHTSSDTLYHFDVKNNKIKPGFMMTFESSEKPFKQYYQVNKELLLTFIFGKGLVATDLKNKTSSWVKVVNDYYGNMPAPTFITQLRNGYWVYNLQPEQLIENIEDRLAKKDCSENDKKILNKTLSTLEEGANNVVFIGKLKSEVKNRMW
ncbi:6-bladed beta-propeller [Proteiniphilum sp.]|uniref:6-bladed beta-propeller n=1 Tax=Proteiniphilum sp. TaxID=1926877 RepID=UPI002B2021C8|nr:6-bladed beta-propeller [Proteiniphilum sp.]MEA4917620.1 6-bladed beta-propeller [Proteiniphilum sp.]